MGYKVKAENLKDLCFRLLKKAGASEYDARVTAGSLVSADLYGVETHGVSRMATYIKRIKEGGVSVTGGFEIIKQYPGAALCDGGGALGQPTGVKAMELAMDKARSAGAYTVFVRNSSHYGMAAYYTRMAAEKGFIGISSTNAPSALPPFGSHEAYLGPNPLSIALPYKEGFPVCLDMSPGVIPRGRLMLAIQKGESIPEGWALDRQGNPTTDPQKAWDGCILPMGGPKGSGLALALDGICGVLAGACFGSHIGTLFGGFSQRQNVGHVFTAIDPCLFREKGEFERDMQQMAMEIKSLEKNPGTNEIYLPGELEYLKMQRGLKEGLELSESSHKALKELSQELEEEFNI